MLSPKAGLAVMTSLAVALPALAACGDRADASPHAVRVTTSFYPLTYAVQQIGGHHVEVTSITPNGAEPHDLQLTPRRVVSVGNADLVVYAKGFQAAVDKAVRTETDGTALDVSHAARLDLTFGTSVDKVVGGDSEEHGSDPHFWLDPQRYAQVARTIAHRLERIDPAHRSAYAARTRTFTRALHRLDSAFDKGLRSCASRTIVTSHMAFGYLAQRYHLSQVGVSGIVPDQLPTPGRLRKVTDFVRSHRVHTIYTEPLVSPAIAETVSHETGATVKVLDPLEGITRKSAGDDYMSVMRANLRTLIAGQGCRS